MGSQGKMPTDEELAVIERLCNEFVVGRPLLIMNPSVQSLAITQIVRAVPGLLRLISAQRVMLADIEERQGE